MNRTFVGYTTSVLCLVLSLTGCSQKTKSEAIQDWKLKGNTEKIIQQLADPQQAICLEAIDALVELQAKDAIEPLGALFANPDLIRVHAAADAIAEIGGPEIEPLMLEAITLDTVPARITGATALGSFKSAEAVNALIIALDDYKYEKIVLAAIKSLGQTGDPKAVDPLCKKLHERSYGIREACVEALSRIGSEGALKGIASRLGDVNETIRTAATSALQAAGKPAVPFAQEALREENHLARANAIKVLDGIGAVPASGSNLVWYHLAKFTVEESSEVDPAGAVVFDSIEDRLPGLLEGLVHRTPAVREYAFIALENMGETAVDAVQETAEEKAAPEALGWLGKRSEWCGAPDWRLDLWGAATALNPRFYNNQAYVDLLAKGGLEAEKVMSAEQFKPLREIIPFLLFQLADVESDDDAREQQAERCRAQAKEHLIDAGHKAAFPLIAALSGDNHSIAVQSARILNTMGGARVERLVVDEYVKQLGVGEEQLPDEQAAGEGTVAKRNPFEELSGTPLHNALFELDFPALDPMRKKIRPSAAQAIQEFKAKHPDVTVISLPQNERGRHFADAVPIRLSYYKHQKMNELKVVYRLNSDKDWILATPIPDELP
ncbi:HEAT repeat domain-containing protein [Pontiellaceae bacterium B12227]|nr:HEAT repeat domain-containing protein [Pontiellaceae bacterium B12227]